MNLQWHYKPDIFFQEFQIHRSFDGFNNEDSVISTITTPNLLSYSDLIHNYHQSQYYKVILKNSFGNGNQFESNTRYITRELKSLGNISDIDYVMDINFSTDNAIFIASLHNGCLLYTSDAADE